MRHLIGKTVLITGGTGFLGKLLVDHLLKEDYALKKVVVYSRRWEDQEKLVAHHSDGRLRTVSGDIQNYWALRTALTGVDVVIHAAAYKSQPSSEYNALECVRVNVNGSMTLIQAAIDAAVSTVLGISSDKACAPCQTYGRTKALMESMMINANNLGPTRFSIARYGNVAGSTGSVIPRFHEAFRRGEQLTITDPNMTRFWFLPENVPVYIMKCIFDMVGGETFIPKLKSSTLQALINAFLVYYNKTDKYPYAYVGKRPGEKVHETMISPDEAHRVIDQGWTYVLKPELPSWGTKYNRGEEVEMEDGYTSLNAQRMTDKEILEMIGE